MKQNTHARPELDFQSLEYGKKSHKDLQPPIFDGDHTYGEDFGVGQLITFYYAKKARAVLFIVHFTAGPDAAKVDWYEDDTSEVEFLFLEKQSRYVGTITRQAPEGFSFLGMDNFVILDGLGHSPDGGGRRIANCWRMKLTNSMLPGYPYSYCYAPYNIKRIL